MASEVCEWKWQEDPFGAEWFETSCGQGQCFTEGNMKDNRYEWCPYCGKAIKEVDDAS